MSDPSNYQARLHWVIYLYPVLFIFAGLGLAFSFPKLFYPGLIIAACGGLSLLMNWICRRFTSLTVSDSRVTLQSGLLIRQCTDIPLSKIEMVDIRQTLLGSLFNFGSIIITGTGGSQNFLHNISSPLICRRNIEQKMSSL